MSSKCNHCINKSQCHKCDKDWKDKFIPSDEVKKFFNRSYVGSRGINGHMYIIKNCSPEIKETHSIKIGTEYFCPYCGEKMFHKQHHYTLETVGYFCICEGARSEVEYNEKLYALQEKHRKELRALQDEYSDKLSFCAEKLIEIKHQHDDYMLKFANHRFNHFSTLNGKTYHNINDLMEV